MPSLWQYKIILNSHWERKTCLVSFLILMSCYLNLETDGSFLQSRLHLSPRDDCFLLYELSDEEDHAHLKIDLDFSERMSSVLSLVIRLKTRSCVVCFPVLLSVCHQVCYNFWWWIMDFPSTMNISHNNFFVNVICYNFCELLLVELIPLISLFF